MSKKRSDLYYGPIEIGCFNYNIIYDKKLEDTDGDLLFGKTDCKHKDIYINDSLPIDVIKETLLHEIQHACYDDTYAFKFSEDELKDADEREEKIIRILNPKLMHVMTVNPNLTEFLFFNNKVEGRGSK